MVVGQIINWLVKQVLSMIWWLFKEITGMVGSLIWWLVKKIGLSIIGWPF